MGSSMAVVIRERFDRWCRRRRELPRKQTRVLTWPIVTVFGFHRRADATPVSETERHADRGGGYG